MPEVYTITTKSCPILISIFYGKKDASPKLKMRSIILYWKVRNQQRTAQSPSSLGIFISSGGIFVASSRSRICLLCVRGWDLLERNNVSIESRIEAANMEIVAAQVRPNGVLPLQILVTSGTDWSRCAIYMIWECKAHEAMSKRNEDICRN